MRKVFQFDNSCVVTQDQCENVTQETWICFRGVQRGGSGA